MTCDLQIWDLSMTRDIYPRDGTLSSMGPKWAMMIWHYLQGGQQPWLNRGLLLQYENCLPMEVLWQVTGKLFTKQPTPLYFTPNQRMSLTTSPNEASPRISLSYNTSEYTDIINRCCSQGTVEFEMAHNSRDYVFLLGNGHPGTTASVLGYTGNVHWPCLVFGIDLTLQ